VCSGAASFAEGRVLAVIREGSLSFEIEAGRLTLMLGSAGLGATAP
jgi:hypothetical protein